MMIAQHHGGAQPEEVLDGRPRRLINATRRSPEVKPSQSLTSRCRSPEEPEEGKQDNGEEQSAQFTSAVHTTAEMKRKA